MDRATESLLQHEAVDISGAADCGGVGEIALHVAFVINNMSGGASLSCINLMHMRVLIKSNEWGVEKSGVSVLQFHFRMPAITFLFRLIIATFTYARIHCKLRSGRIFFRWYTG